MTLSFFEELDFDDGAATEPQEERPARRGRGPRRARRSGGEGPQGPQGIQWQRLLPVVIAFVVVLVVAVWWIRACEADAQRSAYHHYVDNVNSVVTQSNSIAKSVDQTISASDQKPAEVVANLQKLEARQRDVQNETLNLHDTGRLRGLQPWLATTMLYRTQGLDALQTQLARALTPKNPTADGAKAVSDAYSRLLASDVIYADSFQTPAQSDLTAAGINDVKLDDSQFALQHSYIDPANSLQALKRIKAASNLTQTQGGKSTCTSTVRVGTSLDSVTAEPSGTVLTPNSSTPQTVNYSTGKTALVAQVTNGGDIQVTNVQVRLAVPGSAPVTTSIPSLNPGERTTVSLRPPEPNLGGPPVTVRVEVTPVPCETNKSNNSAQYKISWRLAG
jgi:hypothetical protein